jgi:multiple sugar transport system permease protein
MFGSKDKKGFLSLLVMYVILCGFGYVYLMPIARMALRAFMTPDEQIDPKVVWIPTKLILDNIRIAFDGIHYLDGLFVTVVLSVVPALLQTVSTALAGYAFARFEFPLKKLWMVLVVAFYILPIQLIAVPKYLLFLNYNIINKLSAVYLPAILGQGLKSGIFILIFYQFFHSYPKSFDEAAEIDGAGRIKVFYRIALPLSGPAIVISIIFSVVWYWNETNQITLYFAQSTRTALFGIPIYNMRTLPVRLQAFNDMLDEMFQLGGAARLQTPITDGYNLAGTMLVILPMLILYLVLQRQFVESVERSGITGE